MVWNGGVIQENSIHSISGNRSSRNSRATHFIFNRGRGGKGLLPLAIVTEAKQRKKMKGLTSKEVLFFVVNSVVLVRRNAWAEM